MTLTVVRKRMEAAQPSAKAPGVLSPQVRAERVRVQLGRGRATWRRCGRRQGREGCAGARGGLEEGGRGLPVCDPSGSCGAGDAAATGGAAGAGGNGGGVFPSARGDVPCDAASGTDGGAAGHDEGGDGQL